jgi:uncharacterized protein YutE (UPF0331/DUF86 family)
MPILICKILLSATWRWQHSVVLIFAIGSSHWRTRKPADYYEAFLIMGELGVLPADFARRLAPLAGFRNILTHEYLGIDWDHVYKNLQNLNELVTFSQYIRHWLIQ